VAKGAVIGAIGAVVGGGMHAFGNAVGSMASVGAGGSITGTLLHAAAHGVSGGAMAAANGGSFKDGFIGGAIGFGVSLPFGSAGVALQGTGADSIAARTVIAAIGGGVGSKLSGGSFADGAYSAAFFHLFNSELSEIGTQRATLEYPLSQEFPSWDEAVRVTPPASSGWMGKVGSALGVMGMVPGPIGTIAGVLEVGVALLNGDIASAGWALLGAGAALVGAGAAVKGYRAFRAAKIRGPGTETVQRWMSRAELEATQSTGLLRGGRSGTHYVTDSANSKAQRARLRTALPQTPEVRVTMEVPVGRFSAPTRVQPAYGMPGGGMERTATGQIPVNILRVDGR
jgi:hypothetical protein